MALPGQRSSNAFWLAGALVGWVWLLSLLATLGLIVYAIFFNGPWLYVLYSFLVGVVAKWLARGLNDSSQRIAMEGVLMLKGASKERARDIWAQLYDEYGARGVDMIAQMTDEELDRLVAEFGIVHARRGVNIVG